VIFDYDFESFLVEHGLSQTENNGEISKAGLVIEDVREIVRRSV